MTVIGENPIDFTQATQDVSLSHQISSFVVITCGGATSVAAMAVTCHRQKSASTLFFLMSSSGGGLPGRPGSERISGRSLFKGWWGICGVQRTLEHAPQLGTASPR
jgi:hypothetical protein